MTRFLLIFAVLAVACGDAAVPSGGTSSSDHTVQTSTVSVATTSPDVSLNTTSIGTQTTVPAAPPTGPAPSDPPTSEPELACELLPTVYEAVKMPLHGPDPEIFDLAATAGVETFRMKSPEPISLTGEYLNGVFHYEITDRQLQSRWLVGPGFDVRVLGPDGWTRPDELSLTPWLHADPSMVYVGSVMALDHMDFVRWEVVEDRDAGVFVGGFAAVASYYGEEDPEMDDKAAASDVRAEIWMSPDCYPLRVHLEVQQSVYRWELYDMDTAITFDVPEDMGS